MYSARISKKTRKQTIVESLENRRLLSAGQVFYIQSQRANSLLTISTAGAGASQIDDAGSPDQILTDGTNIFDLTIPEAAPGAPPPVYSIQEISSNGQVISQSILGDLSTNPIGSTVSGSDLFVANVPADGSVSEYTTGGQLVHASLLSNLPSGFQTYADGNLLLVLSNGNSVSAYNIATGALVSSSFITPTVSSGGRYFELAFDNSGAIFANSYNGTVDEFNAATGALTKEDLLTLPNWQYTTQDNGTSQNSVYWSDIAIDNGQIFIDAIPADGNSTAELREYLVSGVLDATIDLPADEPVAPGLVVIGTTGAPLMNQLAFATSPASTQIGSPLGNVTVQLESPAGTPTSEDLPVTVSLSGGPAGATLAGTTTVQSVNGVATFSDLTVTESGDAYTITATCANYQSVTSGPFSIIPKSVLSPAFGKTKVPTSVVSGLPWGAKIPVVLTNTGNLIHGKVTVNLFANTSPTLDGNQVLLKSIEKKNLVVKAGHKAVIGFTVPSLAANFTPGTYYLIAQVVDPLERTQLVSSTQTINVAAPTVAGTVTVVASEKYNGALGYNNQIANLTITVTNTGNVLLHGQQLVVSATYNVGGVVSTWVTRGFGRPLGVNGTRTFKIRFRATKSTSNGLYFLLARVSVAGSSALVQGGTYLDLEK